MNSKRLYIIRHGQTDLNKQGIVQGSGVDSSLNDLGRKQADAFYQKYKNHPFDKVYTSALKRTKETVAQFTAAGFPTEAHAGLNEISWGVCEGKTPSDEQKAKYKNLLNAWASGDLTPYYEGGETLQEVADRQQEAMKKILSEADTKEVLIAMHGRAIRILLGWFVNDSLTNMDKFTHSNLTLYVVDWEEGSGAKIQVFDDRSHLEGL
ncbi:histidine phosphatase family protein [Persicobacter psychrovividus]|uniref:Phosphoglycerate mutase n=1 Tax=Persicobacter psychrovividus TaxID=387638 RepID=A0ABN6L823_9BACT|nr:phosphoglycerate mutase [Persicobacter psychrovividus]